MSDTQSSGMAPSRTGYIRQNNQGKEDQEDDGFEGVKCMKGN